MYTIRIYSKESVEISLLKESYSSMIEYFCINQKEVERETWIKGYGQLSNEHDKLIHEFSTFVNNVKSTKVVHEKLICKKKIKKKYVWCIRKISRRMR